MKSTALFIAVFLFVVLLVTVMMVRLVHAETGEMTLNPTDDTYVDYDAAGANLGGTEKLAVLTENDPNTPIDITWLKFDLSSVPDYAVIDSATLQLWATDVPTEHKPFVDVHSCGNISWTEMNLTYENMPDYNGTAIDSVQVINASTWYSWNVFGLVKASFDSQSSAVTFVLDTKTNTQEQETYVSTQFSSKESISYVPRLIVHWSDTVPEYLANHTAFILLLGASVTYLAIHALKQRQNRSKPLIAV
jgi:hypothetical protein